MRRRAVRRTSMMKKQILSLIIIGSLVGGTLSPLNILAADESYELNESQKPYHEMDYDYNIISEEDWKETDKGEYPLDIESTNDISYAEAVSACDMPEEYAESLTTEELVDYAMEYPFLTDVYAFNSITDGLEALGRKSGLFKELFSREDGIDELLNEYLEMNCDYDEVTDTLDITESNYDATLFIEQYLGQNYDNLSEGQAEDFIDQYGENYEKMPDELQDTDVAVSLYETMEEALGYIPEDAIPDSLVENIVSEDNAGASFTKTFSAKCGICLGLGYVGTQTIQNKSITCFKHNSEASKATLKIYDNEMNKYVKKYGWTVKRKSSVRYNCHSYAWYSTATSNKLCLDVNTSVAKIYQDTKYWTKWRIPMRTIQSGDRITFSSGTSVASLQHSAIATSSKKCKSKLGHLGVVKTPIDDMKFFYGAYTTNFYLAK